MLNSAKIHKKKHLRKSKKDIIDFLGLKRHKIEVFVCACVDYYVILCDFRITNRNGYNEESTFIALF